LVNTESIRQKSGVSSFFCDFSAMDQEQRKRHSILVRELLPKHLEMKELPDGFAFRFPNDQVLFTGLSELATLEQLCCPFLTITLERQRDQGPTWLKLTGNDEVKDFLRAELGI
jgi:hypothetical protein